MQNENFCDNAFFFYFTLWPEIRQVAFVLFDSLSGFSDLLGQCLHNVLGDGLLWCSLASEPALTSHRGDENTLVVCQFFPPKFLLLLDIFHLTLSQKFLVKSGELSEIALP